MTRLWLSTVLLAFTLPITAQTTPPKPTTSTGRVVGTVLCSDTHKPCRGADVFLTSMSDDPNLDYVTGVSALSGLDGTFTFDNLPPGKYRAIASLRGYLSNQIHVWSEPESQLDPAARAAELATWAQGLVVNVASSQTTIHDITLLRGASLSGRVLYADGTPAIQAFIRVEHADPDQKTGEPDKDHHVIPTAQNAASTDDLGQFRIPGIRPDHYRIAVVPHLQDPARYGISNQLTFAIYSGDTIHRKAAKVYELRLGDDVGNIDITIPLGGLHSVSGHLITLDNHPLNMGNVTLTATDDDSVSYRAKIDRYGVFLFANVPTGAYTLSLTNAFIGKPTDATKDPGDEDTTLKRARAFTAEPLSILVKDSDLSDIEPPLKETPLLPEPKSDDDN